MLYTTKDKIWADESGMQVERSRITPFEKKKESISKKLLESSLKIEQQIQKHHELVSELCEQEYEAFLKTLDLERAEKHGGNHTFYSFDRSVKVMIKVQKHTTFDEELIEAAKAKLDAFITDNVKGAEIVRKLVEDAFSTSRGRLDHKKVFQLLRYKDKVDDPDFTACCDLISKAIRHPSSKNYFHIEHRQEDGSYRSVNLNFSAL